MTSTGTPARMGCLVLAFTLGCAPEPEPQTPPPTPTASARGTATSRPGPSLPERNAAPGSMPTASPLASRTIEPAPDTPEEARRLLEKEGVDPGELSREIGEQLRQRFSPAPSK